MSCICITGARQPELDLIAKVLAASGMKVLGGDKTLPTSECRHMGGSHLRGVDSKISLTPQRLSQVIHSAQSGELTGWADTNSLITLTEWLRVEPTLCFVLVTSKVADVLAQAIDDCAIAFDCPQIIRDWQQSQQRLLHFYYRHRERCVLVNDQDCLENANELVRECKQRLSDRLQVPQEPLLVWSKRENSVALHFSKGLLESYPEALSLDHELAACVTSFAVTEQAVAYQQSKASEHALLTEYRTQRQQSQTNLKQWVEENTQLLLRVESVQAENKQLFNKYLVAQRQNEVFSEESLAERNLSTQLKAELEVAKDQVAQVKAENVDFLKNNEQLLFDLHEAQRALEDSFVRHTDAEAQINELATQLSNSHVHAEGQKVELEQAFQTNSRLQEKYNEVEAENEILLSQFQQSLIDLETYILKNRALQDSIENENAAVCGLGARLADVTTEYESLNQAHIQWRVERETLIEQIELKERAISASNENLERLAAEHQSQLAILKEKRSEIEDDNERLSSEAQQALVDLNAFALENQALHDTINIEKETVAATKSRLLKVTNEYELISKAHIEWLAEREQLVWQADARQDALTDLKNAYEALLLELAFSQQLAQEQFIQNERTASILDQLEIENRAVESRLSRLLQKYPSPISFEKLEDIGAPSGDQLRMQWRLVGVDTGKRYVPSLSFCTIIEDGALGFSFSRQQASANGLVRWPGVLATSSELVLSPVGDATTGPIRAESWLSLAISDFDILTALSLSLEQELAAGNIQAHLGQSLSSQIASGLEAFKRFANEANSTFRYDVVRLKRATVNDEYEHLWLEFDNVSYNNVRSSHFECRVACSELIAKRFGSYPKLEFPRIEAQHPLNSWHAESQDDFGEKLELRFAPPKLFDGDVWGRLSIDDQGFVVSLLERLPTILRDLDLESAGLHRPWPQWQSVVEHMSQCLEPAVAQVADTPTLKPAAKVPENLESQPSTNRATPSAFLSFLQES